MRQKIWGQFAPIMWIWQIKASLKCAISSCLHWSQRFLPSLPPGRLTSDNLRLCEPQDIIQISSHNPQGYCFSLPLMNHLSSPLPPTPFLLSPNLHPRGRLVAVSCFTEKMETIRKEFNKLPPTQPPPTNRVYPNSAFWLPWINLAKANSSERGLHLYFSYIHECFSSSSPVLCIMDFSSHQILFINLCHSPQPPKSKQPDLPCFCSSVFLFSIIAKLLEALSAVACSFPPAAVAVS